MELVLGGFCFRMLALPHVETVILERNRIGSLWISKSNSKYEKSNFTR